MKVTCRFSGIEFRAEHFNFSTIGEHPLFHLPVDRLLGLFSIWVNQDNEGESTTQAARLTETETKMLFVAFLKATELVHFNSPAYPTYEIATKNLPALAEFLVFRQKIPDIEIAYPNISINELTNDCRAAIDWIQVWNERKANWLDGYKREKINLKLQELEAALVKLIRSPMGDQSRKVSRLAHWAMVASDAPKALHEYWTSLFKLKGLEIYQAKSVDLDELLEHMERNLPGDGMFVFETLAHLREIHARNLKGILYNLKDGSLDPFDLEKDPFKFVEDDMESINKKIVASSAPTTAPKLGDYPNKFLFLKAQAAYLLAQKEIAVRQEVEKRQQEYLSKAALDNISKGEEAEIVANEDEEEAKRIAKEQGGLN